MQLFNCLKNHSCRPGDMYIWFITNKQIKIMTRLPEKTVVHHEN